MGLIFCFVFKENFHDSLKVKVIDVYSSLTASELKMSACGPAVDAAIPQKSFDVSLTTNYQLAIDFHVII